MEGGEKTRLIGLIYLIDIIFVAFFYAVVASKLCGISAHSYLIDYSIISTVQELSDWHFLRHSRRTKITDMSGSLKAGWSFPVGHNGPSGYNKTNTNLWLSWKWNVTCKMSQMLLSVYFFNSRRPQTSVHFVVMENWKPKSPCSRRGWNTWQNQCCKQSLLCNSWPCKQMFSFLFIWPWRYRTTLA